MIIDFKKVDKVYIACGKTDLRKSIDGLSALIERKFELNPFGNILFLFCGNDKSKIKALYWEGDGFLLLYKRLENGRFKWPKNEVEVRQLNEQEVRWLLEGLSIDQPKAIKKVNGKSVL